MQLDLAPIPETQLMTPRLRLRLMRETDRESYVAFEVANTAFFSRYAPPVATGDRPGDVTSVAHANFDRHLRRMNEGVVSGTGFRLALVSLTRDEIIGLVGLSDIVRGVAQRCNIGYRIAENHARQGLMSEAIEALLAHAFAPATAGGLQLHRVECAVQPDNIPSLQLARKLGFEEEGYFRNFLFIASAWRDHIILARTAPTPGAT